MSTESVPQSPPTDIPRGESLDNVRVIARLMDTVIVIPGTNFRVGFDVILGLIPILGDLVGAVVGSYILLTAARLGVPKPVIARMLANIGTDAVVGAVPFVGDVFDAAWRANAKNARLLEQAVAEPQKTRRASIWMMAGLVAAVFAVTAGGIALTVWLVRSLL